MVKDEVKQALLDHMKHDDKVLGAFTKDISALKVDIAIIREQVDFIKTAIEGNGQPGMLAQIAANTNWRNRMIGGMGLLTVLVSYGIIKVI